eukprot:974026-Prymnesium_polylepis.1
MQAFGRSVEVAGCRKANRDHRCIVLWRKAGDGRLALQSPLHRYAVEAATKVVKSGCATREATARDNHDAATCKVNIVARNREADQACRGSGWRDARDFVRCVQQRWNDRFPESTRERLGRDEVKPVKSYA